MVLAATASMNDDGNSDRLEASSDKIQRPDIGCPRARKKRGDKGFRFSEEDEIKAPILKTKF